MDVESDLHTHEAVCAERYKHITENLGELKGRIGRIEKMTMTVAGAVILQLCAVVAGFVATRGGV